MAAAIDPDLGEVLAMNAMSSPMVPLIAGKCCVGFLVNCGRQGVEAFSADEQSLGIFPGPIEAAAAVSAHALQHDGGRP
jgi:hypothetical protein